MTKYENILKEMEHELEDFDKNSDKINNGYTYEKSFKAIVQKYEEKLLQTSMGDIPKSRNQKLSIQTSIGEIIVKKGHVMSQCPMGFRISPYLQEHMCRLGLKLVFEEASEELEALVNISIDAKQIERVCHCYGDLVDRIDWQEAYTDGIQLKLTYKNDEPVYVMADGSMILTREEKWKEIKLGRIFSEGSHVEELSKTEGLSQIRFIVHI